MSAITAKASRKMKKYAVLTREPRCFLGSFDFSWEQRKLGELALFNPKDELPQTFEYVDLESVVGTEMLSHRTEVKSSAPSRAQRLAHTGDLFYQTVRPYQKNNYLFEKPDNNYVFSTGYAQMRPYVDGYFLLSLVQSERFVKVVLDNCTGTSYPAINANDLAEIEVAAPSDESEAQKIGTIFRSIDNLITLHQRKCANLCSPSQVVFSLLFATSTFSWEQRKLSEITDKVTEKNAGLQYVETFTNSAEFGIISQRDFFDHDIAKLGSLDGYYIVKNEDFVYNPRISTSAPVGPINRNKLGRTGVMSPLYTVFRPHDIDTTYLEYFFKCGYWHSFMNFNGDSGARSDRFSIRDNVFFQMPIPIPDIDEQRKIGELLTCLDNLITLHQRECISFTGRADRLILTANKKRTTSSWEQRKLGELVDVCSGRDYKHLSEGTIPVYGTGGYMLSVNDALSYDRDAIGIGRKGTIDRPYILKAPFWTVDTLFYAIPREKADLNFAFDIFQNIDWKKKDESTGVPSLSKTAINDIDVLAPKHGEQQTIGQFFAAIDHLITLHQRKPFLMKWRTSDANRNQTNRLVL